MRIRTWLVFAAAGALAATPAAAQNPQMQPTFGSQPLSAAGGQLAVDLAAGGDIFAGAVGPNCLGFVAMAPDYRVALQGTGQAALSFVVTAREDTTLVVQRPDGGWACDDDSAGQLQPRIDIANAAPGAYNVWVGTYEPLGYFPPATLTVSARGGGVQPGQPGIIDGQPADVGGEYWYSADGAPIGPVPLSEIGQAIADGRITRETLVWQDGMPDWIAAGTVPAVEALFPAEPPPLPDPVTPPPLPDQPVTPPPLPPTDPITPPQGGAEAPTETGDLPEAEQDKVETDDTVTLATVLEITQLIAWADRNVDLDVEILGAQEAVVRRSEDNSAVLTLRDDWLPPAGDRVVEMTVTVEEDGGGWPDRAVGIGLVYAYQDFDHAFTGFILSPQDGGQVQVLDNVVDGGVRISQSVGGDATAVGQPVRLVLEETGDGALILTAGTQRLQIRNGTTESGATGVGDIGLIAYGRGTFRLADLEIRSR